MTESDFFFEQQQLPGRRAPSRKGPAPSRSAPETAADTTPHRVGFLLVPGFALMTYSCAMEPYRAANTLSGRELYRWMHVSPNGKPVAASNGVAVVPDQGIEAPLDVEDLFVCAGGNPTLFDDAPTLAWLRAQNHRGTRIGAVAGGPVILGRAGLLEGYRCTMHWEYIPAFREKFPRHAVTRHPLRDRPQPLHQRRRHGGLRHDAGLDRPTPRARAGERDQRMVSAHQARVQPRAAAHVAA